jgi:hypothetical protein
MVSGDTGTVGGAIDLTRRILFEDSALCNAPAASGGDGTLRYQSTNDADSGVTVTVYGRNVAGSLVEEAKDVGDSGVSTTGEVVFERILWTSFDSHNYDVKVNDSAGNNIMTVESGVTGVMRPFLGLSSQPDSDVTAYSKIFLKNTNSVNALLAANIIETADPTTYLTFAIEDAVGDSGTSADRITAPTASEIGAGGFSNDTKSLASQTDAGTADLSPDTNIGLWLKIVLPSGAAAAKSTYTLSVSGETT